MLLKNVKSLLPLQRIVEFFTLLWVLVILIFVNEVAVAQVIIPRPPEIAATKVVLEETTIADQESKRGLFDIKLLNDIEDIATRASLKKIYMGAKKTSRNSDEVIPDMINELESKDKLTDKIKSLLNGILK